MNHLTRVLDTPAVALETFDHPAGESHHDPDAETAAGFCVNFMEGGSFRVRTDRGARWRVTAGTLFVTTPGLVFSCRHDEEQPTDRCFSVAYAAPTVEHLRVAGAAVCPASVRPQTNRHRYLRDRLASCVRGDEARMEALAGDLFFALSAPPSREPLYRATQLSWYAARVDRARDFMDASYHEPLSLTRIGREVGMSPFHFARVFRELAGVPPHRYLTAVRLAQAARALRAGARVTETGLAVGFGSLSHFVTAFRRRYGVTPSDVRQGRGETQDPARLSTSRS